MGYTTDFEGSFKFNKKLNASLLSYLKKFNDTRRMARRLPVEFGTEGEFYVEGGGDHGQGRDNDVIDHNRPPSTQPGLWCGWVPSEEGNALEWDGVEKFYNYVEWLSYLINNFLEPAGYKLTGAMFWQGEDNNDTGTIYVKNNVITVNADDSSKECIIWPKALSGFDLTKIKGSKSKSKVKDCKLIKKLHALAGEIGTLGEYDNRYSDVYRKLSDALDVAEQNGLIKGD